MGDITPVTIREALSGVFGSVSLACWVTLLKIISGVQLRVSKLPQRRIRRKHGKGLTASDSRSMRMDSQKYWKSMLKTIFTAVSISFLIVWLIGDVCNLIGAVWAGLLPTVIAIAIYFCIADVVMLGQVIFYNHFAQRRKTTLRHAAEDARSTLSSDATAPLLASSYQTTSNHSAAPRRSSINQRRRRDSLSAVLNNDNSQSSLFLKNLISLFMVTLAGALGWAIAYETGVWHVVEDDGDSLSSVPLGAEIFGYMSSVCYLCFFGNVTYSMGILLHSTAIDYVLVNLPWLIGSLGTTFQDCVIFYQFVVFNPLPDAQQTTDIDVDRERNDAAGE